LSVRDCTPDKKKGKGAGDVEVQSSERNSTRGPAEREVFSEESAFAPSLRQKRIKIAQGTRVATLLKRAASKVGSLVHRDGSRFVSTDTAQIVDQAARRSELRSTSRFGFAGVPNALNLELNLLGLFEFALVLAIVLASWRGGAVLHCSRWNASSPLRLA
jgi:hypothetical protein